MSSSNRDSFASLDAEAEKEPDAPLGPSQSCSRPKKARLRLAVRDEGFVIHQDLKYRLEVGEEVFEGEVGSKGVIDHLVPEGSTSARLQAWPLVDGALPTTWKLELGKLLPVSLDEGARARLENLGFVEEEAADAVKEFQVRFELEESGELDTATRSRLDEVYQAKVEASEPEGVWRPAKARLYKPSKTRAADAPVAGVGKE